MFKEYFRRTVNFRLLDLDTNGFYLMIDLFLRPENVFRSSRNRYIVKKQWARDDPSFIVILIYFLFVVTVCYSICFSLSFFHFFWVLFVMYIINFLIGSAILSSSTWLLTNKWGFLNSSNLHVEFMYCLDVHMSAVYTLFCFVCVFPYILLPLLMRNSLVATIFANAFNFIGLSYYMYITWRGFVEIDFLERTDRVFLLPITFLLIGYILSTFLFEINTTKFYLENILMI